MFFPPEDTSPFEEQIYVILSVRHMGEITGRVEKQSLPDGVHTYVNQPLVLLMLLRYGVAARP